MVTKSFWKPLSANTIFVTNDNVTKRRDYEEQVMKVFYLSNVIAPQELQEIVTAVRSVADIQRLFVYNSQNAIIARGEADRIALAEKIISDLDKPRAEVVVDVIVMSTTHRRHAQPGRQPAPTAASTCPSCTTRGSASGRASPTPTTGTGDRRHPHHHHQHGHPAFQYRQVGHRRLRRDPAGRPAAGRAERPHHAVLQSPQLRAVDNQKATLKIGDRQPTATGSFQPGIGGVGINPLVNTQFTFIDVGVNVDITPKVHDNNEISMHVELEISSVRDHVNLGGIDQPVIWQQKAMHDIRLKDGQVNLLAGLNQTRRPRPWSASRGFPASRLSASCSAARRWTNRRASC